MQGFLRQNEFLTTQEVTKSEACEGTCREAYSAAKCEKQELEAMRNGGAEAEVMQK